ncbi:MAG: bifunctional ADP-heptose synthase [Pseudomonadota bacterium]
MTDYQLSFETCQSHIARFAGQRVLIVGDVMLDEYLMGDAERISPEAPVPVVRVAEERLLVGGAANVARNISSLGGLPQLISVCGTGSNSSALKKALTDQGIGFNLIAIEGRPTTIKTRVMARQQQIVRIDREDASPIVGPHLEAIMARLADHIPQHKVIIVSDYGKGLVTAEFMDRLLSLCAAQPTPPAIFVDPKTPNFHLYQGVQLLTPNAKETSEGANLPTNTTDEILAAGDAIFAKLSCTNLLTTLGAQGMALFTTDPISPNISNASDKSSCAACASRSPQPPTVWHVPTMAQRVFDVTGAGDTVIATVALAYAAGISLLDSCILANYAAGIVVGQVGAACVKPAELVEAINVLPLPPVNKWR